jgi:hypothetical protein
MSHVTQDDCDKIAYELNTRPRKRYGYKTPEQLYFGKDTALHLLLEPRNLYLFVMCPHPQYSYSSFFYKYLIY